MAEPLSNDWWSAAADVHSGDAEVGADAEVEADADADVLVPWLWSSMALSRAARAVSRRMAAELGDCGLTPVQALVLAGVWARGPVPVTTLCSYVGLASSSVCPVLDRLVRRGLLLRRPSMWDARATMVTATPASRELCEPVRRALTVVDSALGLRTADRDGLVAQLHLLADALDGTPEALAGELDRAPGFMVAGRSPAHRRFT